MIADLKSRVAHALQHEVAAAAGLDGSLLEVLDANDGIVRLRLHGACAGCPTTIMAMIQRMEIELRSRIPEIEYIEVAP